MYFNTGVLKIINVNIRVPNTENPFEYLNDESVLFSLHKLTPTTRIIIIITGIVKQDYSYKEIVWLG